VALVLYPGLSALVSTESSVRFAAPPVSSPSNESRSGVSTPADPSCITRPQVRHAVRLARQAKHENDRAVTATAVGDVSLTAEHLGNMARIYERMSSVLSSSMRASKLAADASLYFALSAALVEQGKYSDARRQARAGARSFRKIGAAMNREAC
jgi:hypothetical protein